MDPEREIEALFVRHAARGQLPGWAIRVNIRSLDRSVRVFNGNQHELDRHLETPSDAGQLLRLWDRNNPEVFERFLDEVDRLLHNYLAAAMSLRDHARRIRDVHLPASSEDDFATSYERRKEAAFALSPLAQFMQGLRNYSVHRRLPVARGHLHFLKDEGLDSEVVVPTSELLRWRTWNPLARQFLDEAGDEIVLQQVVTSYTAVIRECQAWFREALLWRHREAIRELEDEEEAIAQAFSALTGEPIRRRNTPDPTEG